MAGLPPAQFLIEVRTRPAGDVLPIVRHGDKKWVVGEPGQEFTVSVKAESLLLTDYKVRWPRHWVFRLL